MPCSDQNFPLRKPPRRCQAGIAFRSERNQPDKSPTSIDQLAGYLRTCRQYVRGWMGPDVPRLWTDERPFHMNAYHHVGDQRISCMECRKPADPVDHEVAAVGDDGGKHPPTAVLLDGLTCRAEIGGTEGVGIEVDALIAVELQIKRLHRPLLDGEGTGS